MRAASIALSLMLLAPVASWAQGGVPPAPVYTPTPGNAPAGAAGQRVITRDQFVQRAAQMAGRRFDMMDVNHTGTVTMDQIRAFRAAHSGQGGRRLGQNAPPPSEQ